MGEARKLGNNSRWSVDKADERFWEIGEVAAEAQMVAEDAGKRGLELQDLLIVSLLAELRVKLAQMETLVAQGRRRLEDAREGRWQGDSENVQ